MPRSRSTRKRWGIQVAENSGQPTYGYVYYLQAEDGGPVKIGHSICPATRLRDLQSGSPVKVVVRHVEQYSSGGAAQRREAEIHRRFKDQRLHGEWFRLCPEIAALAHIAEGQDGISPTDSVVLGTVDDLPFDPGRGVRAANDRHFAIERARAAERDLDALGWSVPTIAETVLAQAEKYGVADAAAIDDAIGGDGTRLSAWSYSWDGE